MNKTRVTFAQVDDLNLLRLFVAVAEEGGFSAAARALKAQRSSISRGVASLEQALGVQLFNRSTRSVSLTTAGRNLYNTTAHKLKELEQSLNALPERSIEPSGRIKLTVSQDFGSILMPSLLPAFLDRYPKIELDVRITNRMVDLVAEGFDAGIRPGPLADSQLQARKIMSARGGIYASPRYLMSAGAPRSLEHALKSHTWISGPVPFEPQKPFRVFGDDMLFLRGCARVGLGLCLLPDFLTRDDVASGRLIRLMATDQMKGHFYLVRPEQTQNSIKVDVLSDYLVDALSGPLSQSID